jgi:hypothetical protein
MPPNALVAGQVVFTPQTTAISLFLLSASSRHTHSRNSISRVLPFALVPGAPAARLHCSATPSTSVQSDPCAKTSSRAQWQGFDTAASSSCSHKQNQQLQRGICGMRRAPVSAHARSLPSCMMRRVMMRVLLCSTFNALQASARTRPCSLLLGDLRWRVQPHGRSAHRRRQRPHKTRSAAALGSSAEQHAAKITANALQQP